MNTAIIFLASAIGLVGCTTIDRQPFGTDSGFPPTYPGGKSEYHPLATENVPIRKSDNLDERHVKPEDLRKAHNRAAFQSLEHRLKRKIKFLAVVDKKHPHQAAYMYSDGTEESQAERDEHHCKGRESPPEYPLPPETPVCYCALNGSDGDGLHEDVHMHCF